MWVGKLCRKIMTFPSVKGICLLVTAKMWCHRIPQVSSLIPADRNPEILQSAQADLLCMFMWAWWDTYFPSRLNYVAHGCEWKWRPARSSSKSPSGPLIPARSSPVELPPALLMPLVWSPKNNVFPYCGFALNSLRQQFFSHSSFSTLPTTKNHCVALVSITYSIPLL